METSADPVVGGPRLTVLLLGLALLPLLGVTWTAVDEFRAVRTADKLAEQVEMKTIELNDLDELRLALVDERNWVLARLRVDELGVPLEVVNEVSGVDIAAGIIDASADVDRVVTTPTGATFADEIADARSLENADTADVSSAYERIARSVKNRNDTMRQDLLSAAVALPGSGPTVQALRVAGIAADARYARAAQVWAFFEARFNVGDSASSSEMALVELRFEFDRTLSDLDRLVVDGSETDRLLGELLTFAPARQFDAALDGFLTARALENTATSGSASVADVQNASADFAVGTTLMSPLNRFVEHTTEGVIVETRDLADDTSRSFGASAAALAALAVAALLIAVVLGRYIARPMRRIAHAAERLGSGDTLDLPRAGPAEVRQVSGAVARAAAGLELVDRLEHAATHDGLTGIPLRELAMKHLEESMTAARDQNTCGAVFFIDLDDFKSVNDTYGHGAGDAVLVEVARRLSHAVPHGDVVGRFGGDEFVVVAESIDSADEAVPLGRRLLECGEQPVTISIDDADRSSLAVLVGLSIGVTVFDGRDTSPADVVARADTAVYEAKANGRNQIVHSRRRFTDSDRQQSRRAQLV